MFNSLIHAVLSVMRIEFFLVHWPDEGAHSILRGDNIVHPCPGDVLVGETVMAKFGKKQYQAIIIEKGLIVDFLWIVTVDGLGV